MLANQRVGCSRFYTIASYSRNESDDYLCIRNAHLAYSNLCVIQFVPSYWSLTISFYIIQCFGRKLGCYELVKCQKFTYFVCFENSYLRRLITLTMLVRLCSDGKSFIKFQVHSTLHIIQIPTLTNPKFSLKLKLGSISNSSPFTSHASQIHVWLNNLLLTSNAIS